LSFLFSEAGILKDDEFCDVPYMPTEQQLLAVHSQSYDVSSLFFFLSFLGTWMD